MADTIGEAWIALRASFDQLRADLGQVSAEVEKATAPAAKKFADLGKTLGGAGRTLTAGITVPLALAGGAALKFSTDFNAAMANVATLIPGNAARVNELKQAVQAMAVETGKSTTDLAGGLYQVISAFGDTADTAKVLEINAKAASAGLATTTDAINLTSAVTKGYGDTSTQAVQKVSDLAFQTAKLGQTTFPELAGSIGVVTPLAASLGVSMEELFGVMATGTGVTGSASEVATQFRGILQSLMSPTKGMADLLEQLGYKSGQAMLQQLGLRGSIEAIVQAAQKSGQPLQTYISSIEGQTLALALAGPQADTFAQKLQAMGQVAGMTDEAFKEQTQGVNATGFALAQAQQKAAGIAQTFGDALAPALSKALDAAQPVLDVAQRLANWFAQLDPSVQTAVVAVAAFAAGVGPLLVALGALAGGISNILALVGTVTGGMAAQAAATAGVGVASAAATPAVGGLGAVFTALTGPIGIAIAAITAAIAIGVALWQNWDTVSATLTQIWTTIQTTAATIFNSIVTTIQNLWNGLVTTVTEATTGWVNSIVGAWQWLYDRNYYFQALVDFIVGIWTKLQATTTAVWSAITGWLSQTWQSIQSTVTGAATAVRDRVVGAWQSLLSGIRGMASAVWDALTGPFERARDMVLDIVADAWNWGRNLVANIIDGIKSKLSALTSVVSQVAGKVSSFLGFHSPAKEGPGADADKWAPNLMRMFTQGIRQSIPQLQQTLNVALATPAVEIPQMVAQPIMATAQPGVETTVIENHYHYTLSPGAVVIPAKDLAEMRSIEEFFARLRQTSRALGPA